MSSELPMGEFRPIQGGIGIFEGDEQVGWAFVPQPPPPIQTEREALKAIIKDADLLEVDGRQFLLVRTPAPLMDFLIEYSAGTEDLEDDDPREDADPQEHNGDKEDDSNAEPNEWDREHRERLRARMEGRAT